MQDETFGRSKILHLLGSLALVRHFLTSVLQGGYRDRFDGDGGVLLDFYHHV